MLICYDLTTVSWLFVLTLYVFFRVLFVYFIFFVLLFTVHLCAIDTRFNKCNLLTYLNVLGLNLQKALRFVLRLS